MHMMREGTEINPLLFVDQGVHPYIGKYSGVSHYAN